MSGSNKTIGGLKEVVKKLFIKDVTDWCCKPQKNSTKRNWCVLVLDHDAMQILSYSCKMYEVFYEGIALVEDLFKVREPINLDAIYFLTPTKKSIDILISDFPVRGITKYKAAHIFFTQACPDSLFIPMSRSLSKTAIKSCKELNIAFIPLESQVYSLNSYESFQFCYDPFLMINRTSHLEELAIRISTACYALNEYPLVRYMKNDFNTSSSELAHLVLEKLNILKHDNSSMGDGYKKLRSQLIILDRSFDWISLILHELTFQAMVYDNFTIKNNTFTFTEDGAEINLYLDQVNKLWSKLRHHHISDAVTIVTQKLKKCVESLRASSIAATSSSVGVLSNAIKEIPLKKKKSEQCSNYVSVLKRCIEIYQEQLADICNFEQDLVMNETALFKKINYNTKIKLISFLKNDEVSLQNKMRLIILYIFYNNGISEDIFNEFVQTAQLSPADVQTIQNLNKLGVTVITDEDKKKHRRPERKNRVDENTYQVSRWTPLIKDLMENCIENKLDPKQFPFVGAKENSTGNPTASSSRYTLPCASWYKPKKSTENNGSRIILFMLGGVSYSEMRCAYEVSKNSTNWEFIIGSSNPLTPNQFIQNLSKLHNE